MTRSLITGIAGFTGRYLTQVLASRGHEIHGIVHCEENCRVEGATGIHNADLAHLDAIERIVREVAPDHVVHLAGIAFVAHADVEQIYRSNVVGTRQLLHALVALDRPCRSILIASSANIYGNRRQGALQEDMGFAPANDYGVSKVATELLASIHANRLPLIVVRPFNYTGRGQSTQFLIPKIVAHAQQRAPVIELGNLDVARDFSDVRTVTEIYSRLLQEPRAIGGTFNVASGKAVSIRDVIEMVERLSGHAFDVRVNPDFLREDEVKVLQGSTERLKALLGPLAEIPLEDTIRCMLAG